MLDKTYTDDQYSYAVEASSLGAQLMDEKRAGWYRDVDTDKLDMRYVGKCIAGQCILHYLDTISFSLAMHSLGIDARYASNYGFDADTVEGEYITTYDALTDAWKEQIAARLYEDHTP